MSDLQERLDATMSALDRMTDQRDQLAAQLSDSTRQCGVMAELLREALPYVKDCSDWGRKHDGDLRDAIDAALAGKLPEPVAPSIDYVQGASDFKRELLKSTKAFVHPHIEGVFAVFNNHHKRAMLASAQKPE